MYLRRAQIEHVKGLNRVDLKFPANGEAGWHVILGDNGAGKTTLIRAIALGLVGPREAMALREDWSRWVEEGAEAGTIHLTLTMDDRLDTAQGGGKRPKNRQTTAQLHIRSIRPEGLPPGSTVPSRGEVSAPRETAYRYVWGNGAGWFSSSFGPSRRFTGGSGDYQRIFYSNPRVARHLSAFSEQVALSESLAWLIDKHRQGQQELISQVRAFVNGSNLLPHEVTLEEVDDQSLRFSDGNGVSIDATELSDGYRSILCLALELLRQMEVTYGLERLFSGGGDTVALPGVVLIDEVDAHLHPSWQETVGGWFLSRFPNVQFIVATHSPLVCRSIGETGRVFRLRAPGAEGDQLVEIQGVERDKLWYGSLDRSLESEGFGLDLGRSDYGWARVEELARLNRKAIEEGLTARERDRQRHLRAVLSDAETAAGGALMLPYRPADLTSEERAALAGHQLLIDGLATYEERVSRADIAWSPAKLGAARQKLWDARPTQARCVFCEDNDGDQIEHLQPRTLYPELTFAWENLLCACGRCNSPKGATAAILDPAAARGWREVTRPRRKRGDGSPLLPPPAGDTAWFNPRLGDPLRYLKLDILGESFLLENFADPGDPNHARIDWTLEKLGLNHRPSLVRARRVAFHDLTRWLEEVVRSQEAGDAPRLSRLRQELPEKNHPTVWVEMKRQRGDLSDIDALLAQAPQVLDW